MSISLRIGNSGKYGELIMMTYFQQLLEMYHFLKHMKLLNEKVLQEKYLIFLKVRWCQDKAFV